MVKRDDIKRKERKMSEYTLKNIKTWKGHDGNEAYQASLYRDGTRIGSVTEDGWGGELQVDFKNAGTYKAENDALVAGTLEWLGQNVGWWTGKLDEEFFAPVAAFVEEFVFRTQEVKRFRTKLRKNVLIRTAKCGPGQFLSVGHPTSSLDESTYRTRLLAHYGDGTVILNDLNDTDLFNTVLAEPAFLEN